MLQRLETIVVAGGAGRRLASVTGGVPKQFWSASGHRSLLDDTVARVRPLSRPGRIQVVVDASHRPFVERLHGPSSYARFVYQPCDRGTAAGVLLGLTQALADLDDAVVLLTPADHGVAREDIFRTGIHEAADAVAAGAADVVLFGVEAHSAVGDYGWIVPGGGRTPNGLTRVAAFVEKPRPQAAARLLAAGGVWNTMVLVARGSALRRLFERHAPVLSDLFAAASRLSAAARQAWLEARYRELPVVDFSRDILGHAGALSLFTWSGTMGWSDLGTPERLAGWLGMTRPLPASATPGAPLRTARPDFAA